MILGKITQLRAFQIQHANHFPLVHHGNGQFRARLRIHHQVARIDGHIRNENRLLQRGCRANDAIGRVRSQFSLHAMAVLNVQSVAENLLLFVIKHDAQYLIINHPLGLFCRAPQKLFHLQDRAGFAADFA